MIAITEQCIDLNETLLKNKQFFYGVRNEKDASLLNKEQKDAGISILSTESILCSSSTLSSVSDLHVEGWRSETIQWCL
jgi:hypothetical protein